MPRAAAKFSTRDLERAISALQKSGARLGAIEIGADGSIKITARDAIIDSTPPENPWDVALREPNYGPPS